MEMAVVLNILMMSKILFKSAHSFVSKLQNTTKLRVVITQVRSILKILNFPNEFFRRIKYNTK